MGKLSQFASVTSASLEHFVFVPPTAAMKAARTLVLANLGYAPGAAPALNWGTLAAVLRGLRRASPLGRILIVDRLCPASSAEAIFQRIGLTDALDAEMRAAPVDALTRRAYPVPRTPPVHASSLSLPEYLSEFDCVVVVATAEAAAGAFKGSVSLLEHLLPCEAALPPRDDPQRYHDLYHTVAPHVDAAALEVRLSRDETRILSGSNLLALDETACRLLGQPVAEYLKAL
ncbi:DUF362 domain-containing protein (plasmid) [Aggregatilineales bacterium SYSU G02658]